MLITKLDRQRAGNGIGPFTDQGCFLVSFFTGLISILSLKYLGASQLVVTCVPVLIMLAYLSLMLSFRRMRVDDDQAGDNLYYLGFLFTLTSLGCALFQYHGADSKESIIQNFGIALTTTIVGLICRVIFGQMRHDPVETEREVRMELSAVAARLRNQILETHTVLDTASIAVRQQSAEFMSQYVQQLQALVEVSLESSAAHVATLSEQTRVMASQNAKLVETIESILSRVHSAEELLTPRVGDDSRDSNTHHTVLHHGVTVAARGETHATADLTADGGVDRTESLLTLVVPQVREAIDSVDLLRTDTHDMDSARAETLQRIHDRHENVPRAERGSHDSSSKSEEEPLEACNSAQGISTKEFEGGGAQSDEDAHDTNSQSAPRHKPRYQ